MRLQLACSLAKAMDSCGFLRGSLLRGSLGEEEAGSRGRQVWNFLWFLGDWLLLRTTLGNTRVEWLGLLAFPQGHTGLPGSYRLPWPGPACRVGGVGPAVERTRCSGSYQLPARKKLFLKLCSAQHGTWHRVGVLTNVHSSMKHESAVQTVFQAWVQILLPFHFLL